MKKIILAASAAALALVLVSPAYAHVTVQPSEAIAGSFSRFVVRVPTERPDATIEVEVRFPENVGFVSFQPKEGWDRSVEMRTLDEPIELFGSEVTEVVDSVTWTGGEIEAGEFDEFGFSARVPEEATDLSFPAIQTYEGGEVVEWTGEPGSDQPAAAVSVVELPVEEGQGELGLLAELGQAGADGGEDEAQQTSAVEENPGESNLGVILGSIGIVLGAVALVLALRRRT